MKPEDIDDIFARAAASPAAPDIDRAAALRARSEILAGLSPVRPLADARVITVLLVAVCAGCAVAAASALGLAGLHALAPSQRALIFATLLSVMWIAAAACARAMRPAQGASLAPWALALASTAFPALFALVFRGYGLARFAPEGIPCLRAGLLVAIPTALIVAVILRRGFILSWTTAGLAAGVLAGLAGLAMLELHCANLKAIHVIVWHVAVVISSGVLGWITGRIMDAKGRSPGRPSGK